MKRIISGVLTLMGSMVIVSCDSSGGDSSGGESTAIRTALLDSGGCAKIEGTGSAGDLSGLYDITNYSAPAVNVIYASVSTTGALTEYDYDADSVGSGLNCYFKRQEKFSSFTNIIDDQYYWTFANPFPDQTTCAYVRDEINVTVTSGGASFSTPEFGQYAAWRKLGNLTTEDLSLCAQ